MTEIKHSVASRSAAVVHVIIGNDDAYSRNNKIAQCHQMRSSKTNIPNPSMPVEGFEPPKPEKYFVPDYGQSLYHDDRCVRRRGGINKIK